MQGICIQGPTTYFKEVADSWSGWPNVVWSTWTSEPQSNIDYIRSKDIKVIQSNIPDKAGYLNINYQCISTFIGINSLHREGCTEVLKIRSDIVINDIRSLLEILKDKKLAYLAMCDPSKRKDIYYSLVYDHFSHDYPLDIVVYGEINNMLNMFNLQTDDTYYIPPESILYYNYLINSKSKTQFNLEYNSLINNGVYFFLKDCLFKQIKMFWLKRNIEIIENHNNEYYLF